METSHRTQTGYNRRAETCRLRWMQTQSGYMDGCERDTIHRNTIMGAGIEADVAESPWAYKRARRWRFGVVANAAHV